MARSCAARTATQAAPHLLAASTHITQETRVQVRVDDKTNEIPVAQVLLPHRLTLDEVVATIAGTPQPGEVKAMFVA